jgi:hypothetical protein
MEIVNKPLIRWTIGPTTEAGLECLEMSVKSAQKLYDADFVICYNCEKKFIKPLCDKLKITSINQREYIKNTKDCPIGVAWKLYPPRLRPESHEIFIDNDIIISEQIEEIDKFLSSSSHTLLLEAVIRKYGKFEKHVPKGFYINSGVFGLPPHFDLEKYIKYFCKDGWEENNKNSSKTWDEQGLVATALLNNAKHVIIPKEIIVNCEHHFCSGKGVHFVGLNRRQHHKPFQIYKNSLSKTFL